MPIEFPRVLPRLRCELCEAVSSATYTEGDNELVPQEEGWALIELREIVPNPDREIEADNIAELARQTGQDMSDYPWTTPQFISQVSYGALCPKHAAKGLALVTKED